MKKRTKQALGISIVLLGILIAVGVYAYIYICIPMKKIQDVSWWENASQDEIRQVCHRAIRTRFGAHHDAFLSLAELGNAESVPLLIRALKWQPQPDESGAASCITWHCIGALQSLSGQNAGNTFREWDNWWKKTGSELPPDEYYPRQEKQIHKLEANKPLHTSR